MNFNTTSRSLWIIALAIGVIIELGCQTIWLEQFGNYEKPLLWLSGGLLTVLAAFKLLAFAPASSLPEVSSSRNRNAIIICITAGILIPYIASLLYPIFQQYPSDPNSSDILPSLEFYVRRFLSGETVYAPMKFPSWVVHPTYFPLLWMPYIFSELLQIDYRWTAYLVFLIPIMVFLFKLSKQEISPVEAFIKAALPFALIYAYIDYIPKVFGHAVELLPIGFYLILSLSVFSRHRWLMGLGILLCLLSRYAFTFWLPLYLLIIWIERGFKEVFQVSMYVLAGVIVLYIIPFMSKDWGMLTRGLAYYSETAVGQWYPQSWQAAGDKPFHLNQGLSVAIYFYDLAPGEIIERLALNRKVHLLACGLAAMLIAAGYFFYRKKGLNVKWYMLIALKFYILIFYGFFYVPFSYLFMLPMFLSLPLIFGLRWKEEKTLVTPIKAE